MERILIICEGAETCLEECECKKGPHKITRDKRCDDPGSCYHNNHVDGQYHEYGHILYNKEVTNNENHV